MVHPERDRYAQVTEDIKRAETALTAALASLEAAERYASCWTDSVRQGAEQRLGITDVDDQRILNDRDYGAALDRFGFVMAASDAAREAVRAWRDVGVPPIVEDNGDDREIGE